MVVTASALIVLRIEKQIAMTTNFEKRLRQIIPDSATKVLQRNAKADVELLLQEVHSMRALIDLAQNSRAKANLGSAACWALGQLQSPQGVPVLLSIVERARSEISWEAAKSLVVLLRKGSKGTRKIKQALLRGRSPHNRAAAAYVLGLTGNKSTIPLLVKILESSDTPDVRSHVAEALGNIGDVDSSDSLIPALSDPSPEVRFSAAYALGELGDERAIAPLKRLASAESTPSSNSDSVKAQASKSIRRIRRRSTAGNRN
jgi:hypothetical protein